jgi:hypothetical protein
MILTILLGVTLGIVVNIPAIIYVVWSRALLKRHFVARADNHVRLRRVEVCLRILFGLATVSIIWPVASRTVGGFAILSTYDVAGEERVLTEFLIAVGFWPDTITSWITGFPWLGAHFEVGFLHWAVVTVLIVVVLLAITVFQWLRLRSRYRNSVRYNASPSA